MMLLHHGKKTLGRSNAVHNDHMTTHGQNAAHARQTKGMAERHGAQLHVIRPVAHICIDVRNGACKVAVRKQHSLRSSRRS